MPIFFRPAKLDKTPLLIGLAGPSGAGKTMSALRLAKGIAGGGKVFMIDTEARRGLHYASMFDFQHGEMNAPFTPLAYQEAIECAAKAGAKVCIVDSTSHAHEGPGGILEQHESELSRMAGDDYRKREQMKFAAWIGPKREHNRFVNTILQVQMHMIFCFRAKDKLELKRVEGKIKPTQAGWTPICTDRFEYEQTMLLVMPPGAGGVPDLNEPATKIQEQHRKIITPGKPLSEEMGAALAAWASGEIGGRSKGQTGDSPAHQGNLTSAPSDQASSAKVSDPPSSIVAVWEDAEGKKHNFSSIDSYTNFVLKGINSAKSAEDLRQAINRNSPPMQKIMDAGYKTHIDEIIADYDAKMKTLQAAPGG